MLQLQRYTWQILRMPSLRYMVAQISSAAITFLMLPLLTRWYDPSVYGQYLLIVSSVTLVSATMTQWLQQTILRVFPGHATPHDLRAMINGIAPWIVLLGAFIVTVLLLYLPGIVVNYQLLFATTLYAMLLACNSIYASIQQAQENAKIFALYIFFQNAVPVVCAVLLSFVQRSVEVLILSQIIGNALSCIFLVRLRPFSRPSQAFIRGAIAYGLPLSLWMIGAQLLNNLDRFMIAYYLGADAAGVYATNYNVVVSMQSFLFSPLLIAVHPVLMRLWNQGDVQYQRVLRQSTTMFLFIAALAISFFVSSYSSIATLLLGPSFRNGAHLMPLISIGHIMWSFASYLQKGFEFKRQTWKMFVFTIVAVAANFLLNIISIPVFGIDAAAYTTIISYMLYCLLVYIMQRDNELHIVQFSTALIVVAVPLIVYLCSHLLLARFDVLPIVTLALNGSLSMFALGIFLLLNKKQLFAFKKMLQNMAA